MLRNRNTTINCFGLQSHLVCHRVFARKELTRFLKVVDLGYSLMITELDVNNIEIPGSVAEFARRLDDAPGCAFQSQADVVHIDCVPNLERVCSVPTSTPTHRFLTRSLTPARRRGWSLAGNGEMA